MPTYLLTWNPTKWDWVDLAETIERVAQGEAVTDRWSIGNTRQIQVGDRVFLMHLGTEPRGVMASGRVTRAPFEHPHWHQERAGGGHTAHSIMFEYDALLDPQTELLPVEHLQNDPRTSSMHWLPQSSGTRIPADIAEALEEIWSLHTGAVRFRSPDELPGSMAFSEGKPRQVLVNRFERSPAARARCIQAHGTTCSICGFDFDRVYGEMGRGYIHVHHLVPMSQIDQSYEVDPIADLRPVCPNCHAMLHRRDPPFSIEEMEDIIHRNSSPAPI